MIKQYTYKPLHFFASVFFLTWIAGFIAAYASYQSGMQAIQLLLMLFSMLVPAIVALTMIYSSGSGALKQDFIQRLCTNRINWNYIPFMLLLMPIVLYVATTISVFFGYSAEQFKLSSDFNVLKGQTIVGLLFLLLAPLFEEIGWRGYGVDSLRSKLNLFNTTMLFALLWALWHLPLFFINGYYQNQLWHTGIVYVVNFFLSMLPAAILLNWIYYKNNRSIWAVVLFHFMINLFSVLFRTEQITKCIITLLLLVVSGAILFIDQNTFFADSARKQIQ